MERPLHLALLGAMPEEIGSDLAHLNNLSRETFGDLVIHRGQWQGDDGTPVLLTLAWSGWGKVCAARTATRVLASVSPEAPIDLLLFTGVAGGADPALQQWDVVLADSVVQHDLDVRPILPRFVVPPLNRAVLEPQKTWFQWALNALEESHSAGALQGFGRPKPGLIGTGDQFIGDAAVIAALRDALPDLQAVEMEGAAVAQVAEQEDVPWLVLRVISDGADSEAAQSFNDFVQAYDARAWTLIETLLRRQASAPRR